MEEKKEASDKKKERDFGTCPLSPFQLTRYTSVIKSLCLQAGLAVIWEALSLFKCHWRCGDAEHSYNELALIGVGGAGDPVHKQNISQSVNGKNRPECPLNVPMDFSAIRKAVEFDMCAFH